VSSRKRVSAIRDLFIDLDGFAMDPGSTLRYGRDDNVCESLILSLSKDEARASR